MIQGFGCGTARSPIKIPIDASKSRNIHIDEKPRTVTFGADNSKESFAAFSWAVANLIRPSDLVLLVHVYQTDYVFGSQYSKLANDTNRDLAKGVVQQYEDRCKKQNLSFRSIVACGNPAKVISEATVANRSCLCVLGSKRRSYLMRVVLGSLVSVVLEQAGCPVMIIKKPKVKTATWRPSSPQSQFFTPSASAGRGRGIPHRPPPPSVPARRRDGGGTQAMEGFDG
jgi:nucleotide-binding universal stress UspA family protein